MKVTENKIYNPAIECMDRDELKALQLTRLQDTVKLCYERVPLYRQRMDALGVKPEDMYVVSIMPCSCKKFEKEREQLKTNGMPDVDAVLTTRELGRLIRRAGINFPKLPDEDFDTDIVHDYSGAGVIFGVTGGVMEAALRTVYFVLTGKEYEKINFTEVRGLEGVREATIDINGTAVNVAVATA